MEYLPVVFARNHLPGSLAIRLFCRSRWSHVGIVVYNNYVLEATAFNGVVLTPIDEFAQRYSTIEFAKIPVVNKVAALELALDQLGKRYDWMALLGIALRTRWGSAGRWFCSELVAHCSGLYRAERVGRAHLEHIWMISK